MTNDKLYTSLSPNTIMAILTNHVQRARLITSSTNKHYSLNSENDFRWICRNVSLRKTFFFFFSELLSPGRSHYTTELLILLGSNHLYRNRPLWDYFGLKKERKRNTGTKMAARRTLRNLYPGFPCYRSKVYILVSDTFAYFAPHWYSWKAITELDLVHITL